MQNRILDMVQNIKTAKCKLAQLVLNMEMKLKDCENGLLWFLNQNIQALI
ncbi:hypothetical protein Halhy_1695 [Haliscomenobacter hydrossis DSM 1100]|uniref:Uncharacterized protein n=1 Tax=Haliscomenobacter hydrossis (strain ATCC 27775 / DSM 1100 / LMG 10767 / O) TaxID=760192 RepID=F4L1S5_HALH1|nr:hypothetical protein Halhy_1695 [Haliscomenobacter hydrossis DSM 1100]